MAKTTIQEIIDQISNALELPEDDEAVIVLSNIIGENHDIDDFIYPHDEDESDNRQALQDFIDAFDESDSDQFIEFDGNEYRIIKESDIWDIYKDEIQNIITDCYDLKLDNVPDFIAIEIDWEKTAENAYADGYGHTFSSYDGSEIEISINKMLAFYVFRTN